jgi:hypothetical protein
MQGREQAPDRTKNAIIATHGEGGASKVIVFWVTYMTCRLGQLVSAIFPIR